MGDSPTTVPQCSMSYVHCETLVFLLEVEDDPKTGLHIVGRGGFPNSGGVLECDAAIMEGITGRFGAVAALRG